MKYHFKSFTIVHHLAGCLQQSQKSMLFKLKKTSTFATFMSISRSLASRCFRSTSSICSKTFSWDLTSDTTSNVEWFWKTNSKTVILIFNHNTTTHNSYSNVECYLWTACGFIYICVNILCLVTLCASTRCKLSTAIRSRMFLSLSSAAWDTMDMTSCWTSLRQCFLAVK